MWSGTMPVPHWLRPNGGSGRNHQSASVRHLIGRGFKIQRHAPTFSVKLLIQSTFDVFIDFPRALSVAT